jgi:hypothetical protein
MSGFHHDAQGWYVVSAPGDNHDYNLDLSELLVAGETIQSVVWTVPEAVAKGVTAVAGGTVSVWLSTPTVGSYFVDAAVTTDQGRTFNRGFRLLVCEEI